MEKADEFVIENGILKKYSGSGQHVSVPEGTEIIGPGAFRGCGRIKTVSFPGSVKKIGEMAFYDCRRLAGVRLPEDLEEIGDRAFQFCRDLDSVRIPGKVKRIGAYAFAGCGKLESLSMDRVPESIGESAFTACPLLADPDGFVIIGGILFDYAGESPYVHIPHSVWKIGENAFWGPPAVREVFLPEGLACIGSEHLCKICRYRNVRSGCRLLLIHIKYAETVAISPIHLAFSCIAERSAAIG